MGRRGKGIESSYFLLFGCLSEQRGYFLFWHGFWFLSPLILFLVYFLNNIYGSYKKEVIFLNPVPYFKRNNFEDSRGRRSKISLSSLLPPPKKKKNFQTRFESTSFPFSLYLSSKHINVIVNQCKESHVSSLFIWGKS